MKRSTILILALVTLLSSKAATKRALVIGIGDYPATSGWAKINGDKDIPLVEEMLIANGFSKQNIVELKNQQATCAAICREFENLIAKSQAGDYIYIHFSGHGQQITDLNGDETIDHMDEAWIPYDAQYAIEEGKYEGENHLVDDQLNFFLHRLRQSVGLEGQIIVVADACHSGDGTRGEDDEETECIRGTDSIFTISNVKHTIKRFAAFFRKSKSSIPSSQISAPQPTPLEWIYISACKDYQCNREFEGRGSLTTALYRNQTFFGTSSVQEVFDKVKKFYNNPRIPKTQTPVLEVSSGAETVIFLQK